MPQAVGTDAMQKVRALRNDVVPLICRTDRGPYIVGTGFIHGGVLVTAGHVPSNCQGQLEAWNRLAQVPVAVSATDASFDLSILRPTDSQTFFAGLTIAADTSDVRIGRDIAWLGFPNGSPAEDPILGIGGLVALGPYLTGPDSSKTDRWYFSGDVIGGNSGGPLLDPATGSVIGVVKARVLRVPHVLAVKFGFLAPTSDPHRPVVTEHMGVAVTHRDLRQFLQHNNIE